MERSLKIIYISLISLLPLVELLHFLFLFPTGRYLEFALANIFGVILALSIDFFLLQILKRMPSLTIFVREMLWILIAVLGLASLGGADLSRISIVDTLSLVGPVALLGAAFLASFLSINALRRIRCWERIGIRSMEIPNLLREVKNVFHDKEYGEISWVYKSAQYLTLLYVTQQMNLALTITSDIFEKLIKESYKILEIPIPKDERDLAVGYPKRAKHLGLDLKLDGSDFDFEEFWDLRGKYVHGAIERTVEIVPSEEEMERSFRLLSKILREYPNIMASLRKKTGK